MKKNNSSAFTLIEVLLSTVIIVSVLISAFYAITFISVGKIRLIESTRIEKEGFYFSEKLFEMVKQGGILDFEEYFNRKTIGSTTYSSGYYLENTGFGNFGFGGNPTTTNYGDSHYYCLSPSGANMGIDGCLSGYKILSNNTTTSFDYTGSPQRYGQYIAQFIDYNSDEDGNIGDENGDGNFKGDDDDIFIGRGPNVFDTGVNIHELYLISGDKKTRTLFRWNVGLDPDSPIAGDCDFTTDTSNPTGDGCLGTIEFLVLEGKDWGDNHNTNILDTNGTQYDGTIDTWTINSKFSGNDTTVAAATTTDYWERLFPDSISVSNFEIYAYPNKDIDLAWKENNSAINQAPYIKMKMTLSPSWKKRKIIQGTIPSVDIATTISLTDEFSQ